MPLTAIRTANGQIVEAFDLTAEQWQLMKSEPPGSYLIRRSGLPAVLKKNVHGTRWFAARPGESNTNWKPTSPEHEFAQVRMIHALRSAGFTARIEEPGCTPSGERWEADVYIDSQDRKIAIEVQISKQSFDEYLRRTEKYIQSGIKVVWLISNRNFEDFTLGCLKNNGWGQSWLNAPVVDGEQFHRDFPAFPVRFNSPKGKPTDNATRVCVPLPPKGWPFKELTLEEFAVGLAQGALTHSKRKFWLWNQ